MHRSNVQSHRQSRKSKQNVRNSHVKKYLTNVQHAPQVHQGTKRTVYKRLKNESNRRSRIQAQSRFSFLNRGLSRLNSLANKGKQLSNAYQKSQQKRNAQGTKVATFLQSKFRMGKAKKQLNQLRNHQLLAAKERVRRIQEQRNMIQEDEAQENAKENALRKTLNRTKNKNENNLQGFRNKLSLKNKLKNMTNSVKKLDYSSRSIPKNRSKSTLEKAMNSTRVFLTRKTPHWITLGAKSGHRSRHVKPFVKRVTKPAPK